jgi:hypothetical protein
VGGKFYVENASRAADYLQHWESGEECLRHVEIVASILVPVGNLPVACFDEITTISVCESVPVRSGLDHRRFLAR